MTVDEWRVFLTEFNQELLECPGDLHNCPPEALATGWLGFPPASGEQINATEIRLGKRLPPSLRSFYAVSNGWRDVSSFIWDILPVEKLDWVTTLYPNACMEPEYLDDELTTARDEQDRESLMEQGIYVNRSAAVSGYGDAGFWLLDPEYQDAQGEWRGGHLASWYPGTYWSANSFAELMQNERKNRKELL